MDDGSDDDSGALLDGWADRDPRFTVVHQPAEGLVAALNRGLEHCRAPLVARMDADDISHPRRLELQAARFAARPEVGVVSCLVRHFPSRGVATGFRLYEEWLNSLVTHDEIRRERFVESPVAHPSVMVRREVLTEIGGWRDPGLGRRLRPLAALFRGRCRSSTRSIVRSSSGGSTASVSPAPTPATRSRAFCAARPTFSPAVRWPRLRRSSSGAPARPAGGCPSFSPRRASKIIAVVDIDPRKDRRHPARDRGDLAR